MGARKAIARVQSDSEPARRSVNFDLASVRCETLGWIFGGDSTLYGKTSDGDFVFCQTKLLKGRTSSNLDLSSDNVDARDFFGNGMFDLAALFS